MQKLSLAVVFFATAIFLLFYNSHFSAINASKSLLSLIIRFISVFLASIFEARKQKKMKLFITILLLSLHSLAFGQSEEKKLKLLTGVSLISPDSNTTHFNLDLGINQYKWKDDYNSLRKPFFRFTNTSIYTNIMFVEKPVMGLHYNFLGGGFIKAGLMSLFSIGGDLSIMTNFQEVSLVIQPEIGISLAEYGKISIGPSISIGNSPFQSFNQVFSTVKIHIYHHTLKKTIK